MPQSAVCDTQGDTEDCIPVASLEFTDSRVAGYRDHFDIFVKDIFRIGRDTRSNTFALPCDEEGLVSRNHCEIYAVKYDSGVHHVYARDRGSCNGTYVNSILIGVSSRMASGYLLQDGDEVRILPHWRFTLSQLDSPPPRELTKVQAEEAKLFQDKYGLTSRCLGEGAEATVYLATEAVTKRQLVCKMVNLDKIKGKNAAEEIRRRRQEVDILRQVSHPNILPYIDAIASPHTLYTFTELAAGGDLMSFIYRHDVIPEFDSQVILRQIISGLEYLHHKGIVHRDLKPENILLANSPKIAYCRVMLSDFGASAVPRRSRMITNVGTMRYQAPEVSQRDQSQGPAVDMWSLGIVTLLMLAPYGDCDHADLNTMEQQDLEITLKNDFFKNSTARSPEAQKFVWQCLQVEADARLTAPQAARHHWLNSSPAHIKFFETFDRKARAGWTGRAELNAMPLDIPCVLSRLDPLAKATDSKDSDRSVYFKTTKATPVRTTDDCSEVPQPGNTATASSEAFTFQKPAIPSRTTAAVSPQKPWAITPTTSHKSSLKYGERARRLQSKRKRMSELKIRPDLKIHEGMHLPLNNLDRHLTPTPNTKARWQVLRELKQSKALFLEK